MANHKSAIKRIRANERKRLYNRFYAKSARTMIKNFRKLTDVAEAKTRLPKIVSVVDKLVKRGVIHKNKAANIKSKLMRRMNAMAS
ncbi:MAG: 30S ribosomal protein S20 [Bacteroidales bacterium]